MKFSGPVKVSAKTVASKNIFSLDIISPQIASQSYPGQFIQVKIPGMDTLPWPRPFSVHKVSDEVVTISIKKCGKVTELLYNIDRGDRLYVTGPLGNGFKLPPMEKYIYLVAGGVGLPPLHFLCEYILEQGYPSELIHFYSGARCADELFANDELTSLGIDYIVSTDDGSCGIKGFITEPFAGDLMKIDTDENKIKSVIYSCGPTAMMKKMAELCHGLECYLSLEQLMPCGWGVCNGCAVKIKAGGDNNTEDERGFRLARVCKEGPVFKASELIWD
jgi:dihydroorotate dehydrogenase electron transfer subunit